MRTRTTLGRYNEEVEPNIVTPAISPLRRSQRRCQLKESPDNRKDSTNNHTRSQTKKRRTNPALARKEEQEDEHVINNTTSPRTKSAHYDQHDEPKGEINTNEYHEVNRILGRRLKQWGENDRQIVEYLVSWKGQGYNPSWMVAENLDQNSLEAAFRLFPSAVDTATATNICTSSSDEGEESSSSDEEDLNNINADNSSSDATLKADAVSHLAHSEYDKPGTAELVLHRKCYRVGQSYYERNVDGKSTILTICNINPQQQFAECNHYMRIEDTFTVPKNMKGRYVRKKQNRTVELHKLKKVCKQRFKKCPFMYEQFDREQRSGFAYYHEKGKIACHFPKQNPATLDLFAGAGGMACGYHNVGLNVKWAVENNPNAAATLRANMVSSQYSTFVYAESVEHFIKQCTRGDVSYPSVGDVDHIHASPPCKGFSRANRCENGGKDGYRNNQLTLQFVKAVRHFQPMTATFENVPGLMQHDHRHYLEGVTASLIGMKYQVRCAILNASSFGDPQNRRRLFLWASRNDCILPKVPMPTHGPDLIPLRSVKDAIGLLEEQKPKYHGSGAVTCRGIMLHNHLCSEQKPSGKDDEYILLPDEPARTVLAMSRPPVHYRGDRYVTVREAACLQSFPPTYQFFGAVCGQYQQVGNAVPVMLATDVARSVANVHGLP